MNMLDFFNTAIMKGKVLVKDRSKVTLLVSGLSTGLFIPTNSVFFLSVAVISLVYYIRRC